MERKHIQGSVYRNVFRRDKQYLWQWITEERPRAKSRSALIPVSHFFLQTDFCLEVNMVCECVRVWQRRQVQESALCI